MRPISRYRPPVRSRDLPLPPRWQPREAPIDHTRLMQFVVLSMLLHALAIMLFGAPSGGSREGRAMWGSLNVVLGPYRDPGPTLRLDRTPIEVPPSLPIPALPAPVPAPPVSFPPLLDRLRPSERTLQMAPALQVPLPTEVPKPPAPPVIAAPAEVPAPLPATPAPARAEPTLVETPALAVIPATPPIVRPPVEIPSLPSPSTETLAQPSLELAPTPEIVARPEPAEAPRSRPAEVPQSRSVERANPPPSPFKSASPSAAPSGDAFTFDPTLPTLDPEALRARAGQLARQGSGQRALLPFPMPAVPPKKSKLEAAIENARKPDCRTAYQNLGLAAVVPLIANEFGEGSCRW